MIYLIDGHNLLHKFREIKHRIFSDHIYVRDYLINTLLDYFKSRPGTQIYLYFDNKKQQMNRQMMIRGIHVRYSRPDKTADDLIKSEISRFKHLNDRIIVVSDDQSIINYVQGGNIFTKSSSEFHKLLKNKPLRKEYNDNKENTYRDTQLSDQEVDKWMELFNEDGDD